MTNSKIYWWLLILFLANGCRCCYCCWKEERTALLQLKAYINCTDDSYLSSWVTNGTSDCCQWEGIACSNTTKRVTELSIEYRKRWLFNASLFIPFKNLNALLLPDNSLAGWAENEGFEKLRELRKLESLDLSMNQLNRSIVQSLSQLSSLKSLNLAGNNIGSGFEKLRQLRKLESLDLSANQLNRSVFEFLSQLSSLKSLKLSYNNIESGFEKLRQLGKLESLDLSWNLLNRSIFESLSQLSSLKSLNLKFNNIGSGPERLTGLNKLEILNLRNNNLDDENGFSALGLCDLKYLEELTLSRNSFIGKLPTCLGNLTYLRVIDLTENQFTGNIASSPLSRLLSLEYLLLANNNFEIPISFESFANHSKLNVVTADNNSVILQTTSKSWIPKFQLETLSLYNCSQMPSFLHYQLHLRFLRLPNCNIGGKFPNWLLENNSRLEGVYLDGNAFTGSLQLPFLPNLKDFNISNNKIRGQLPPSIGSIFPNLVISTMSNNMLEGLLPSSFGDMKDLEYLDLSENKLTGYLPIGLARKGSKLWFLRLSNNMFNGEIFPIAANINNLQHLYLDGNNFSGPIPQKLSTAPLRTLDLSSNKLSGNIPAWLGNISSLTSLALSKNHLKGHIPPDYCRLEGLEVLNLSENNLVGMIPSCFSAFRDIKLVYLNKNKLQGEFNMFSDSSHLKLLDLRDNNFSGSIPKWWGSTNEITTLLLKGNRFQGTIPPQLCNASYLRILDISHNNLSGPIPHCLGNIMQHEVEYPDHSTSFEYVRFKMIGGYALINTKFSIRSFSKIMFQDNYAWVGAEFTTKYNTYSYEGAILGYMSGVDLSCNQLSGEIPKELGNLTVIHALNLSHNHLTGAIPPEFSNLHKIESMDLSYNNLTGRIPTQLLELTTLEVFTVAHNNLTGRTPQRSAQFGTFNESSYVGNPFLCGPPLLISCTEAKEVPIYTPAPNCCEDDASFLEMESFYISLLVAYANVVVAVVVVLWVNPYWRNVWFYYIETFMYSCYDYFASKRSL